jgi:hypothetical protein
MNLKSVRCKFMISDFTELVKLQLFTELTQGEAANTLGIPSDGGLSPAFAPPLALPAAAAVVQSEIKHAATI